MGAKEAFESFKKYMLQCDYFYSEKEALEYIEYYKKCREIVASKCNSTWWSDEHPNYFRTSINKKDDTSFYKILKGRIATSSAVLGSYSYEGPHVGKIDYTIKARPFYCFRTGLFGSSVFYKKNNNDHDSIDDLDVTIANYIFNDEGQTILISSFAAKGKRHLNSFDYLSDPSHIEKYKDVFGSSVYYPRFHFNSEWQNKCQTMTKPNAIDLEHLFYYLKKLDKNDDEFLNSNNLGMPFLAIKKGEMKYRSNVDKMLEYVLKNKEIKNSMLKQFFEGMVNKLSDEYQSTCEEQEPVTNLDDVINDVGLFYIFIDLFYTTEDDIVDEFANAILCSLNGNKYTPIDSMKEKNEKKKNTTNNKKIV